MTKIKKILISSISLILCVFLVMPTFSKYTTNENGILFDLNLGSFSLAEKDFIIENTGEVTTSESLWGSGQHGGVASGNTNLKSLGDKAFLVKNNTTKQMKISLLIEFYLHALNADSYLDAEVYKVEENAEVFYCRLRKNEDAANFGDGDIGFSRVYNSGYFINSGYKCNTEIVPDLLVSHDANGNKVKITNEEIEKNFVLTSGESAAFHFAITYSPSGLDVSVYSQYVSVKLKATPYG